MRTPLLFLIGLAMMPGVLPAQYRISASLPANSFLLYEGVPLTVQIENRSGDDLVIGGTNANAELVLRVKDLKNRPLPATGTSLMDTPWVIPHGSASSRELDLVQVRPVRYAISYQAEVSLRVDQEEFSTNRLHFDVSNGVPYDRIRNRKSDRTFQLFGLNRNGRDEILLRVSDYKEDTVLYTYTLENHLRFYPPEMLRDDEGIIHTLHYKAPNVVVHCRFNEDGTPVDRRYFSVAAGPRVRLTPHPEDGFHVPGGNLLNAGP